MATVPSAWFQVIEWCTAEDGSPLSTRVHAKTYGTTTTLCGLDAVTLTKRWDEGFVESWPDACRSCAHAFASSRAAVKGCAGV